MYNGECAPSVLSEPDLRWQHRKQSAATEVEGKGEGRSISCALERGSFTNNHGGCVRRVGAMAREER